MVVSTTWRFLYVLFFHIYSLIYYFYLYLFFHIIAFLIFVNYFIKIIFLCFFICLCVIFSNLCNLIQNKSNAVSICLYFHIEHINLTVQTHLVIYVAITYLFDSLFLSYFWGTFISQQIFSILKFDINQIMFFSLISFLDNFICIFDIK